MFLRDSRLKFKALGQSFQGISGLHYWINKEKLKDHNMEPVGLENTRFWAECAQNSPRTLPTLQILRAHSLGVPKLSRSRPTNFGTTHLGRIQSTLMSFPRVRLMLEHPKVFSWRWLVRYAYLLSGGKVARKRIAVVSYDVVCIGKRKHNVDTTSIRVMGSRERERGKYRMWIRFSFIQRNDFLQVCCQFSINDVEYIESGSLNLILVSNQLKKSSVGCMLFMAFMSDEWEVCSCTLTMNHPNRQSQIDSLNVHVHKLHANAKPNYDRASSAWSELWTTHTRQYHPPPHSQSNSLNSHIAMKNTPIKPSHTNTQNTIP